MAALARAVFILVVLGQTNAAHSYKSDLSLEEKKTEILVAVDGVHYMLNYHRVTWTQARIECELKQGTLAVLETEHTQTMVARALVESNPVGEDWWVAAYFNTTTNQWMWSYVEQTFQMFHGNKSKTLSGADPGTEPLAHCVALHSLGCYNSLLLANLPCTLERPFLCQLPGANITHSPRPILPPINFKKDSSTLVLYSALFTRKEADNFCHRIGQQLAVIKSSDIIWQLREKVLRSRPAMLGTIWVGGEKYRGQWTWIPHDNHYRLPYPDSTFNVGKGCMGLNVLSAQMPLLVDYDCNTPGNYVCQTFHDDDVISSTGYATVHKWVRVGEDDSLYLSLTPLPWEEAARSCAANNGHLLHLDRAADERAKKKSMAKIGYAMTHSSIEVNNIWLGARMVGKANKDATKWSWTKNDSYVSGDPMFSLGDLDSWADVCEQGEESDKYPCLNLDHEEPSQFMIYGIQCDYPQHFICQGVEFSSKEGAVDGIILEELEDDIYNGQFNKMLNTTDAVTKPLRLPSDVGTKTHAD